MNMHAMSRSNIRNSLQRYISSYNISIDILSLEESYKDRILLVISSCRTIVAMESCAIVYKTGDG